MRNKKLLILIVLSIGAVFSLIYGTVTSSKGRLKPSVSHLVIKQGKNSQLAKEDISAKSRPKRTDFASWGRNPFMLKKVKDKKLTLNGIIWDAKNPQAVINGEIVGVGDKVSKYSVVDININAVVLNDGKRDFELRLGKEGE